MKREPDGNIPRDETSLYRDLWGTSGGVGKGKQRGGRFDEYPRMRENRARHSW